MDKVGQSFMARCGNRRSPRVNRSAVWFFTVDNADESMWTKFSESLLDCGIKDYVFQLEKSPSGLVHFQGVCRYSNPRESWPNIEAHWERCRNWRQAVKYCTKVDTRIAGPWTNIAGLTWRKTILDPMSGKTPRSFQRKVLNIIKGEVDERKIYWFWDPDGNTGKSTLAKHLVMNYNTVLLGSGTKDCLCCLKLYMEDKDVDIVVFDIPRVRYNDISYEVIESVKNGMLFSGKYESGFITFNVPHVIVFANYPPDRGCLSEDRWVVKKIKNWITIDDIHDLIIED